MRLGCWGLGEIHGVNLHDGGDGDSTAAGVVLEEMSDSTRRRWQKKGGGERRERKDGQRVMRWILK